LEKIVMLALGALAVHTLVELLVENSVSRSSFEIALAANISEQYAKEFVSLASQSPGKGSGRPAQLALIISKLFRSVDRRKGWLEMSAWSLDTKFVLVQEILAGSI
jgi:hypothetical protein